MNRGFLIALSIVLSILITGCSIKNTNSIPDGIYEASNDLEIDWHLDGKINKNTIIVMTSLVNVNNLNETSDFGRIYSETMLSDLVRDGWKILDFRGKGLVIKDGEGEFYLNRKSLRDIPSNAAIFVGTYGQYKDGLLINLRLIDSKTGLVLVANDAYLSDKEAVKMSKRNHCLSLCDGYKDKIESSYSIKIIEDDCTSSNNCIGKAK